MGGIWEFESDGEWYSVPEQERVHAAWNKFKLTTARSKCGVGIPEQPDILSFKSASGEDYYLKVTFALYNGQFDGEETLAYSQRQVNDAWQPTGKFKLHRIRCRQWEDPVEGLNDSDYGTEWDDIADAPPLSSCTTSATST